jgi:hypothetical protein
MLGKNLGATAVVAFLVSTTVTYSRSVASAFQVNTNWNIKRNHGSTTTATATTKTAPSTSTLFLSSSSSPKTSDEMFSSAIWPPIKAELDTLPVFCCANRQGQPLQYNVNGEINMPFFYADVQAVESELQQAKGDLKTGDDDDDRLGIIPVPLGTAFELMAQNQAVIIPSAAAVQKAFGDDNNDDDVNPLGLPLPLFGCMEIKQETKGGTASIPLFLDYQEAEAAVQAALSDAVDKDTTKFEIVSLSLPRAVQMLATDGDTQSFRFIPPKASLEYIRRYLEDNNS